MARSRRRRNRGLVRHHLEKVSARLLEKYEDLLRDHIRGENGIYALYDRGQLYYVGLASNLRARLKRHQRDHHEGRWDRFSVYLVADGSLMKDLESLVIRITRPGGNKKGGRLIGSENLYTALASKLRKRQLEERRELIGERSARGRKSSKRRARVRSKKRNAGALAPYVTKRFTIRGSRRGEVYRAQVLNSGWISFEGHHYRSPSGAAKAALKRSANGWTFWKYRESPGNWLPLARLRGR